MIMNKTELLLSEGWKFHFGECEEAWYQGYDDRAFERVMLPHDWAVAYPFSKQYSSGTGYLTGGIGWYRLHFYLPEEYQGKAIRLVFDGVYKNSQVWVNSYYQGKHPYGYTGFSYDISGIAHFGEQENDAHGHCGFEMVHGKWDHAESHSCGGRTGASGRIWRDVCDRETCG